MTKTLYSLKVWLDDKSSRSRMVEGVKIEKKDLNIVGRYSFWFISYNMMSSQNKPILPHPKTMLVGSIIDKVSRCKMVYKIP